VRIEDKIACRGITLKRVGAELIGPCPVCGGKDRFAIHTKKQLWNCRNCGVGGNDAISLVQHLDACDFVTAVTTLADDSVRHQTSPAKRRERDVFKDDKNNASGAVWLWSRRKPIAEGTPPSLYLRKRGYAGPLPATLGYLRPHDPYPAAMIAAFGMATEAGEPGIIRAPHTVTGVHLTRLTAEGEKAPDANGKAKIMLGVCKGAPITISPPNDLLGMAVTEGVEDGLTVYHITGLGVWAAGSATLMPALAPLIPNYIETVTVYAHDDATGRNNAIDLARAIKARGIEVRVQGL
jgi:putative DNA primase/helicase